MEPTTTKPETTPNSPADVPPPGTLPDPEPPEPGALVVGGLGTDSLPPRPEPPAPAKRTGRKKSKGGGKPWSAARRKRFEASQARQAPPGSPPPPAAEPLPSLMDDLAMVQLVLRWPFDSLLATRLGPHWRLSDPEARELAARVCKVADKYLPAIWGTYHDEIALGMCLVGMVTPRVLVTIHSRPAGPKQEPTDNGSDRHHGPEGDGQEHVAQAPDGSDIPTLADRHPQ